MGISGLLPLLKSIHKPVSLKQFTGQVIGVDAFGWLHRGAVACAIELALDKPTTRYVEFAINRVRMLLDFGITPYLVFDGGSLPSKAGTNARRRQNREQSKSLGLGLYKAHKISQAYQEFQKAIDITPLMARQLIEELKRMNVRYVVAPYEADAQLVYLERKGIINAILSEDSDLLVFGAKCLLTKLNQHGECIQISREEFPSCREISLVGWTDAMFRRMAILSGCDYLPNLPKLGIKTAYRYVRTYKDVERMFRMIQFEGNFAVPIEYPEQFKAAELTFLHHRVFCPLEQRLVLLEPLPPGMDEKDMPFLGQDMDQETAIRVAYGDLNPKTLQPLPLDRLKLFVPQKGHRMQKLHTTDLKTSKSIDSFFPPHREPLAELDPNSLTPSLSQRQLLRTHVNASWEMRTVSSAPQLRRTVTSVATSSQPDSPLQRADRASFLTRAAAISTYQAPKRQRLCESDGCSPLQILEQSPFFPNQKSNPTLSTGKKNQRKKARKSDFEVWSDDSVSDEILLGLSNVQQAASPDHSQKPPSNIPKFADDEVDVVPQSSPACPETPLSADHSPGCEVKNEGKHPYSQIPQLDPSPPHNSGNESASFEGPLRTSGFLQTFVYQSPSRRAVALASMKPSWKPYPGGHPATAVDDEESSIEPEKPLENDKGGNCAQESAGQASRVCLATTFSNQPPNRQAAALASLSTLQNEEFHWELGRVTSAREGTKHAEQNTALLVKVGRQALEGILSTPQMKHGELATSAAGSHININLPPEQSDDGTGRTNHSSTRLKGSEDYIVHDTEDELSAEEQSPLRSKITLQAYAYTGV